MQGPGSPERKRGPHRAASRLGHGFFPPSFCLPCLELHDAMMNGRSSIGGHRAADVRFVDSHCHLDMVQVFDSEAISWMKEAGCLPVSWSFCGRVDTADDLKTYFVGQKDAIARLNREGLRCYYLCGVHPRNIPPDLAPSQVPELLLPCLDDPFCLGIGEIGLETGSGREKEILRAHLDMAEEVVRRGKVFGIHTPRRDKKAVTEKILDMLKDYIRHRRSIVVDHCTGETIASVLRMGLWAGITMSPEKTRVHDLIRIIHAHGGDTGRIMLNTDSGASYHRDLSVLVREESIGKAARAALLRENALVFYRLA